MKTLIKFAIFLVLFFLLASEAWSEDEFDSTDCVITAIQPEFNLGESRYRMGGLCNSVHSFTLSVYWDHWYRRVSEEFESDQYGDGYLVADCPKDPVLTDGDCTYAYSEGVYTRSYRLISRDRLSQEQKAALKQEFDSLVPPPSIDSPAAGVLYGEKNLVGDKQYRVPLRLTLIEPANRLSFKLLALVGDESGQVSMQEVLTKKASLFSTEKEPTYESSMLLPPGVYSLHATARTVFLHSVESVANFTVGDRAKMRDALSVKALRRQIQIPRERAATQTVKLDKAAVAPMQNSPGIDQAATSPTYKQFTVISPRPGVQYTTAPRLKVFVPQRDDVIYALIQCAGPDNRQPCDHQEGGIAAYDLHCVRENMGCSAEMPFGFEMPLGKAYSLYIRPDSSMDLVEVKFELGAMAEQLTQQAATRTSAGLQGEVPMVRVRSGVVVESIEQRTNPIAAGQTVDLQVWLKNNSSDKTDIGLKYSVVCEIREGNGACPFRDAAYTVGVQIDPGARHAVKLTGSIAQAGIYAITVAAPLPGKGEPFTGNSVTRIVEVIAGTSPIKRTAVKRVPD